MPNLKGSLGVQEAGHGVVDGVFYKGGTAQGVSASYSNRDILKMDAHRYSSTYQDDAPVQQRATQMYLYFYLGDTGEIVDHQIASIALELFNEKAGINLDNITTAAKGVISNLSSPKLIGSSLINMGNNSICPTDGVIRVSINCDYGREVVVRVNGQAIAGNHWTRVTNYSGVAYWSVCPVSKGDVITFAGETGYVELCSFYPTKGGV